MKGLLLLFQSGFLLFLSLLWLLWLKLQKLCWIGHLCLVPDFRGNAFNFSPLRIMFAMGLSSVQFSSVAQLCPTLCDPMNCSTPGLPVHHQLLEFTQTHGFIIYGFYCVEVCSFYACFLEGFYHKWMLNFVKCFLCIYWDNDMFLSFNLLTWYITLIDFWILKNPCILGINPTWSWCMILFIHCWIWLANILLRIFAFIFIRDICL